MIRPVVTGLTQPIATPLTTSANIVARYSPANGLVNRKTSAAMSFARASIKIRQCDNMLLPNDYPAVCSDIVRLEGSATNKVTCAKSNPSDLTNITKSGDAAAMLSVVNDATELAAAGLSEFGPNVYMLDNSTGTGYAFIGSGSTGNTNAHSVSVYARGSGQAKTRLTSGVGDYVDLSSKYVRIETENQTPADNARSFSVQAAAGSVVYFTLPQLEEGPVCTSPIPGGTGAITRASEGSDTSNNGLTMPLTQAMIDSLVGECVDFTSTWVASGSTPDALSFIAISGDNKILAFTAHSTNAWVYHASSMVIGQTYEVGYGISSCTAGNVYLGAGASSSGTVRSNNGAYTERLTCAGTTNLFVKASPSFDGTVTINYCRRVLDSGQTL